MTLEELISVYPTGYAFGKATGMSPMNWYRYKKRGYVPITAQQKIERITNGLLKAKIEDAPVDNYRAAGKARWKDDYTGVDERDS